MPETEASALAGDTAGVTAGDTADTAADRAVAGYARAAADAAYSMAAASDEQVARALTGLADLIAAHRSEITQANARDVEDAERGGMSGALLDRLRIDDARLDALAGQLADLAALPAPPRETELRELPGGLRLVERRRPIGVLGVNYEARPLVTIDVASQLIKSRNAGVLRCGSAALASAEALHHLVVTPALAAAGIDPAAVQLVREPGREFARALVRRPGLINLVIVRGSGETTAALAAEAARHGVRTLAHAEGGGVLYIDTHADLETAARLLREGTDRLGVCNRVNLVLVERSRWDDVLPLVRRVLAEPGIVLSAPPHDHPLGHEWALDTGHEATVTIAPVAGPREAAELANTETSGLAATIVTEDDDAAAEFLDRYHGTGAFLNATTRLLDGGKLLGVPETGINVDSVPGPRGPVTFADLVLRQYLVRPA